MPLRGCCCDPPVLVRRKSCWIKQNEIYHESISAQLSDPWALWLQVFFFFLEYLEFLFKSSSTSRALRELERDLDKGME